MQRNYKIIGYEFQRKQYPRHGMQSTVTIFQGTSEQFFSHVQMVLETIHERKLDKAYHDACKEDTGAEKILFKPLRQKTATQEFSAGS
jgi:hypothetical protein